MGEPGRRPRGVAGSADPTTGAPAEQPLWQAFVDESGSDSKRDPGTYIVSAALCYQQALDDVRATMTGLLLPGQRKLHWRDESDTRRALLTQTIASCGVEHVVVVRSGSFDERPERQRRLALERLWQQLAELSVLAVLLESRGAADDRRDLDHLQKLRSRQLVTPQLRIDHAPGPSDPMLWIPDAVCGAVVSSRTGTPRYQDALTRTIQLEVIDLNQR